MFGGRKKPGLIEVAAPATKKKIGGGGDSERKISTTNELKYWDENSRRGCRQKNLCDDPPKKSINGGRYRSTARSRNLWERERDPYQMGEEPDQPGWQGEE